MKGRPAGQKNKKYFIQLKELNTIFGPESYIPISKDFGLTMHEINPKLVITDNTNLPKPKKTEDKIQFEIK